MGLPLALKESSWIEKAEYDIATQTLTVVANGTEYTHSATPDVAFSFEKADSPGAFYNENLKVTDTEVAPDEVNVSYEVFVKSDNVEGTLKFTNTSWSDVAFRLADFDNVSVVNVTRL